MIWNKTDELMPREELRRLQSERLKNTVRRVYDNVPFYREKMNAAGVKPKDIRSIDDIALLPFTVKDDLRDNYPYGLFAAPMEDIVRLQASSGTTGRLTVVGYTQKDIATWAEVMARAMSAAGADRRAVVQIAYGYGLFTGGLGAHYGAERVGATVVPTSAGNTERQVRLMRDFGSTVLCCTPSYALHIADTIEEMHIPREQIKLKSGIFGAEPWTDAMRRDIEKRLSIKCFDIYGLSEITGPGVSVECTEHNGLHVAEDCFFPEIIDPETGAPLPDGQTGELVFTTIAKEGMPLLRYRTRDLSSLDASPCPCGRTHRRMQRIMGRSDDMIVVRGVNVFPTQVEAILIEMGELAPHYLLVVNRENNSDTLEVQVEMSQQLFSDEVRHIEEVERKIKQRILTMLGISAKVRLVEPHSLPRSEGKAKRVLDNRNK